MGNKIFLMKNMAFLYPSKTVEVPAAQSESPPTHPLQHHGDHHSEHDNRLLETRQPDSWKQRSFGSSANQPSTSDWLDSSVQHSSEMQYFFSPPSTIHVSAALNGGRQLLDGVIQV